jgi:hypothetical protein
VGGLAAQVGSELLSLTYSRSRGETEARSPRPGQCPPGQLRPRPPAAISWTRMREATARARRPRSGCPPPSADRPSVSIEPAAAARAAPVRAGGRAAAALRAPAAAQGLERGPGRGRGLRCRPRRGSCPPLAPEGALRPVAARMKTASSPSWPQALRDAGDQRVVVAPGRVRAPDAAGKQARGLAPPRSSASPSGLLEDRRARACRRGRWRTVQRAAGRCSPCRRRPASASGVKGAAGGSRNVSALLRQPVDPRTGRPGAGR